MIALYVIAVIYAAIGLWIACSEGLTWWARPLAVLLWLPVVVYELVQNSRRIRG